MRSTLLTLITALAMALALPAATQAQLSLELRGSLNNPVSEFGDETGLEATSEAGLGADLFYNVSNYLSVYGGWSTEMFGCETCADDDGLTSSGFEGGLKLLANRERGILPWLRAGVVAHQLELESGAIEIDSDTGVGFQVAAGADIPLGEVLSFTPALRYQAYDADLDLGGATFVAAEQRVQFLALDLGLHIHLSELGAS